MPERLGGQTEADFHTIYPMLCAINHLIPPGDSLVRISQCPPNYKFLYTHSLTTYLIFEITIQHKLPLLVSGFYMSLIMVVLIIKGIQGEPPLCSLSSGVCAVRYPNRFHVPTQSGITAATPAIRWIAMPDRMNIFRVSTTRKVALTARRSCDLLGIIA